MTLKIEILGQTCDHFGGFEGPFDHFGVQKFVFCNFSKLFRSFLGSVLAFF